MEAKQLPLSTFNNVKLYDYPDWVIISGNSIDCAKGAIGIASATGSTGATHIEHEPLSNIHSSTKIAKFAIVKRI